MDFMSLLALLVLAGYWLPGYHRRCCYTSFFN